MHTPIDSPLERHLNDAEIAAITHGDTSQYIVLRDATRQAHLDMCPVCRDRVAEARRLDAESAQLLHALDVPVPDFDVAEIIGRAQRSRWTVRRIAAHSALAASLLVCVIGAVAFAFPTSPLGRVLERITEMYRPSPQDSVITASPSSTPQPLASGIALIPTGPLTIEFRGTMPAVLHVRYCDTTLAALRVVPQSPAQTDPRATRDGSGDHIRFTVSNNRIRVTTTEPHDVFELTLPEHMQPVHVMDDHAHPAIVLAPSSSDHIMHGCHAPVIVPLTFHARNHI